MARFTRLQVYNTIHELGLMPLFYHEDVEVVKDNPAPKRTLAVGPENPHNMVKMGQKWRCTKCGIETRIGNNAQTLQWRPCKGSVIKRMDPKAPARKTNPKPKAKEATAAPQPPQQE